MTAIRLKKIGATHACLILLAMLFASWAQAGLAGVTIVAPTINLPHSDSVQTGSFEIFVTSDLDPQPEVGAQNVYLQLPLQSDVTFTGVDIPTLHPYIFGGAIFGAQVIDPNTASVTDFTFDTPPQLTEAPGWGLLLVNYSVAAGVSGSFALTFDTDIDNNPFATELLQPTGAPIPFTVIPGSINVAVPEPSTLALAGLAGIGIGLFGWQRATRLSR